MPTGTELGNKKGETQHLRLKVDLQDTTSCYCYWQHVILHCNIQYHSLIGVYFWNNSKWWQLISQSLPIYLIDKTSFYKFFHLQNLKRIKSQKVHCSKQAQPNASDFILWSVCPRNWYLLVIITSTLGWRWKILDQELSFGKNNCHNWPFPITLWIGYMIWMFLS